MAECGAPYEGAPVEAGLQHRRRHKLSDQTHRTVPVANRAMGKSTSQQVTYSAKTRGSRESSGGGVNRQTEEYEMKERVTNKSADGRDERGN